MVPGAPANTQTGYFFGSGTAFAINGGAASGAFFAHDEYAAYGLNYRDFSGLAAVPTSVAFFLAPVALFCVTAFRSVSSLRPPWLVHALVHGRVHAGAGKRLFEGMPCPTVGIVLLLLTANQSQHGLPARCA